MKSNKILKIGVLALALGALAACGDNGEGGDGEHKCTPDSTWATSATKHWHKCTDTTCKIKSDEAAHTFGAESQTKAPSCTEAGTKEQVCTVCNYKKTSSIAALGHVYEQENGADKVTWTTTPDCVTAGVGTKTCTRCNAAAEVNADALGHTFEQENGADKVTWTTEPGCEVDGAGTKHCTTCNDNVAYTENKLGHTYAVDDDGAVIKTAVVAAQCEVDGSHKQNCTRCNQDVDFVDEKIGHDIRLIDDDGSEPETGKAKVRLYKCSHTGCDKTYFGFKATEVSPNAGRLVFSPETAENGEEQGARFWGRPIGNKMELNETGGATARPDDLEAVYDATVQGDLFEYVFDLTAEQVAAIGETALLYCDAAPADYLNGQDFWACDPKAEEWTPGMYIEGEKAGQPIENYRYILYVDGSPVEFDSSMTAPVTSNTSTNIPRGEYVLPYKFNLHVGENKISLRMAGGYRSLFYNFTFRPYVAPAEDPSTEPGDEPVAHVHAFGAEQSIPATESTVAYKVQACECGAVKATIDVGSDMNKNLARGGKLGKGSSGSYDGTKISKYAFGLDKAYTGTIYAYGGVDSAGNDARSWYDGKSGSANAFPLPDGKTNTVFTLNDSALTLSTKTYGESSGIKAKLDVNNLVTEGASQNVGLIEIANVTLAQGLNTLTMAATSSYGIQYLDIVFIGTAAVVA